MTMRLLVGMKADASGDTPVTVTMTWSLREWKYARDQMQSATDRRPYEYGLILRAIESAVGLMESRYNIEVRADE